MDRERQARGLGQRIPGRHVEPRDRDQADAFEADQPEPLAPGGEVVERRQRFAALASARSWIAGTM